MPTLPFVLMCATLPLLLQQKPMKKDIELTPSLAARIAVEIKSNFETHIRDPWFPRSVDLTSGGGFHQEYSENWTPLQPGRGEKSIVYQSRLTYLAAQIAGGKTVKSSEFAGYASHGIDFLQNVLWDKQEGGFYWAVDAEGKPETDRKTEKHAYGISFGIYAAAEVARVTKDEKALTLAKKGFLWLDKHAHDHKNGGYYEALRRDGTPLLSPPSPTVTGDPIGTHYGYKSMNTHIHLLEAFTSLYAVWHDESVRKRLEEVFLLVRDKIAVEPGCLNLFFTPDWRAIPDHDSFGHDVETAFLLEEAAIALGKPHEVRTEKVSRSLVDHALAYGWDEVNGGFYDAGTAFGKPVDTAKVWWTQAEGLNALLQMHLRYKNQTQVYGTAFVRQWAFIRDKQTDAVNRGWITRLTATGEPDGANQNKSDAWKEPYHQGRAALHVLENLHLLQK